MIYVKIMNTENICMINNYDDKDKYHEFNFFVFQINNNMVLEVANEYVLLID